jgi:hypothetical protein
MLDEPTFTARTDAVPALMFEMTDVILSILSVALHPHQVLNNLLILSSAEICRDDSFEHAVRVLAIRADDD